MEPSEIVALLSANPFQPFTLFAVRGGTYEVTSPDGVLVTPTEVYVPDSAGPDGIRPRVRVVALAKVSLKA